MKSIDHIMIRISIQKYQFAFFDLIVLHYYC